MALTQHQPAHRSQPSPAGGKGGMSPGQVAVIAGAGVILAGFILFRFVTGSFSPFAFSGRSTPAVRATAVPGSTANHDAAMRTFAKELPQLPGYKGPGSGAGDAEIMQYGFDLVARGLPRLDSKTLFQRAELMHQYFTVEKDVTACAGVGSNDVIVYRNGKPMTSLQALMETLDRKAVDNLVSVMLQAAAAELKSSPVPPAPSAKDVQTAASALSARLPRADAGKIVSILSNLDKSTDYDVCWAVRHYYQALTGLGEPARSTMARTLLGPS